MKISTEVSDSVQVNGLSEECNSTQSLSAVDTAYSVNRNLDSGTFDFQSWQELRDSHVPNTLYARAGKRVFDIITSVSLIILLTPLLLILVLIVRLSVGPGVIFKQSRIGCDGKTFNILKFRTMLHDRRSKQKPIESDRRANGHKVDSDPRHTRLGRRLRKLGLDELPQLFNVAAGDMSLVGPRPEMEFVAKTRGYLYHCRHTVRPGITGPYQISDLRKNGDLRSGLSKDTDYVQSIAIHKDLTILCKTPLRLIKSFVDERA